LPLLKFQPSYLLDITLTAERRCHRGKHYPELSHTAATSLCCSEPCFIYNFSN